MNIKLKPLLISIGIALATGVVGMVIGGSSRQGLEGLALPSFMPPPIVFPIVWTILYVLMGIAAYIIYMTDRVSGQDKKTALTIYFLGLIVNSLWTLIFFRLQLRLLGFFWILIILALAVATTIAFSKINPAAAYLMIPYIIWLIFASILNLTIYFMNK